MNLQQTRKKLSQLKPFIVFDFFGIGNCLAFENEGKIIPLSIALEPPSVTTIMESGQITTLILRYSRTFQANANNLKKGDAKTKTALSKKIMDEMKENILGDENKAAEMVGIMARVGKLYTQERSLRGWYQDEKDSFKIIYFDDKDEANKFNEKLDTDNDNTQLGIWLGSLSDKDVMNVATELISSMPTDKEINVPISDAVAEGVIESEKSEGGDATSSVPAANVADFSRQIRRDIVEDVRKPDAPKIGNKESLPSV